MTARGNCRAATMQCVSIQSFSFFPAKQKRFLSAKTWRKKDPQGNILICSSRKRKNTYANKEMGGIFLAAKTKFFGGILYFSGFSQGRLRRNSHGKRILFSIPLDENPENIFFCSGRLRKQSCEKDFRKTLLLIGVGGRRMPCTHGMRNPCARSGECCG